MGRLKRERESDSKWPNSLPILADSIQYRLKEQESSESNWGSCLYPADKRPCPSTHYFSNQWCVQNEQKQIPEFQMLELPVPTPPKVVQDQMLGIMKLVEETKFSDQDDDLIMRARALNISWAEIAAAFQGISQTQIRKRYQELQTKRVLEQQLLVKDQANGSSVNCETLDGVTEGSGEEATRVTRMSARINNNENAAEIQIHSYNGNGGTGNASGASTPPSGVTITANTVTVNAPRRGTRVRSTNSNWWAGIPGDRGVDELSPVQINLGAVDNSAEDVRIKLSEPLSNAPEFNTIKDAHRLSSLKGVKFFRCANVVDPDDPKRIFKFNLENREHAANFIIGVSAEGAPLLSYSDLYAFYELTDGTKWAEHGDLLDIEDLQVLAKKLGKDHSHLLIGGGCTGERELFKKTGRTHSRLQNIEMECYIFNSSSIPDDVSLAKRKESYYYKVMFNPYTLDLIKLG